MVRIARRTFGASTLATLIVTSARAEGPAAAASAEAKVMIDNFTFTPAELRVTAGTTVLWTNRDDIPHTITDKAHPRDIRSPVLDTDETYKRAFPTRGTFVYFCSLHPHMQGSIVVT